MPPKRGGAATTAKAPAKPRRSKLAKDNDISAEQEREIQEAWALHKEDEIDGFEDEKQGVVPTRKIPITMRALGIEPKSQKDIDEYLEILDPENDGYVTYTHFVELAAIQINNKSESTKDEEVEAAFKLFTKGIDRPITIHDLRQTAKLLKEDISDDVLQAMIREANGGGHIGSGVNMEQFRDVMTRAGVLS